MTARTGHYVVVIDNFNRQDPESKFSIFGFVDSGHAKTYGTRRVRSSIEQFREPGQSKEQLYRKWMALGEEVVVDGGLLGLANFDRFAMQKATGDECDYLSIAPPDLD
jgi:hypothetical protein